MKIKLVIISSILLVVASTAYALTYEERQEKAKEMFDAQVKRQHELRLAQIKAQALADALQLQAGDVKVESSVHNSAVNYTRIKNTQENTNK